jgi:hypothetical protein
MLRKVAMPDWDMNRLIEKTILVMRSLETAG